MTIYRDRKFLISLVNELRKMPHEIEWVEFKLNNDNHQEIGEYISSLSNSAALHGKAHAYLIWGIDDNSHEIIGTTFMPYQKKIGAEELENWLLKLLQPKIGFYFFEINIDGRKVVILEIQRAVRHPVRFKGIDYIRIGSYQKRLKDFPELERKLWRVFDDTPFEEHLAVEDLSSDEVIRLLDYPSYFDLLRLPLPDSKSNILKALESDSVIVRAESGQWNITNFGAILLAKRMTDFGNLKRKAARVIVYRGNS